MSQSNQTWVAFFLQEKSTVFVCVLFCFLFYILITSRIGTNRARDLCGEDLVVSRKIPLRILLVLILCRRAVFQLPIQRTQRDAMVFGSTADWFAVLHVFHCRHHLARWVLLPHPEREGGALHLRLWETLHRDDPLCLIPRLASAGSTLGEWQRSRGQQTKSRRQRFFAAITWKINKNGTSTNELEYQRKVVTRESTTVKLVNIYTSPAQLPKA